MQRLFDKILTNRIKEVFYNHQEKYNPDAWKKLKRKMHKKKRSLVYYIYIAKAASIAFLIGISTIYVNKNTTKSTNKLNTTSKILAQDRQYEKTIKKANKPTYKVSQVKKTKDSQKNIKPIEISKSINKQTIKHKVTQLNTDTNQLITNYTLPLVNKADTNNFQIIKDNKASNFDYSVAFISLFSFEETLQESNFSIGAEFLTSFRITKIISIESGLLIAKQEINYMNNQLLNNYSSDFVFEKENNSKKVLNYTGIDIPLNLNIKLNKWIFSSGISSTILLNENISQNSTINKSLKKINSFNPASTYNLSLGYKFQLQKGSIVLEGFAKNPLRKISSANIRIKTYGFSIHYQF